jgi:hypothetical protein
MDDRQLWDLGDPPAWERDLDALVRPSLLVDPPAHVQASILAAVLQVTAPAPWPIPVPVASTPIPAATDARPIPLAAYLLLAAVLVAYVAALSWLEGLFGGSGWLPTLLNQLLAASELVFGRLPSNDPSAMLWLLVQRAPWLALLPLAWLLWERDRAAAPAA